MPIYLALRELISRTMHNTDLTIIQYIKSVRYVSARSIYIAIIFSGFLPFAIAEVAVPTDEQLENLIQKAEQIEKEQAEAKKKEEAEKLKAEAIAKQKAEEEKRRREEAAKQADEEKRQEEQAAAIKAEEDKKKAEAEARQKAITETENKAEDAPLPSDVANKSEDNQKNKEESFGDFVLIPDGTVVIQGNTIPVKSFKIGKHAITNDQWHKVIGDAVPPGSNCGACIVTKITWDQVQQFIDKLNNSTKHKYRLPTSVEWIYACKMGNKEKNCNGNNIDASYIPITESTPVQSLGENEFGVIGMGDKIFEWTCSKYSEKYRQDYWNNCLSAQSNEYAAIHGRDKDIGTVEYNFLNSNLLATTHKPAGTGFRLVLDQ